MEGLSLKPQLADAAIPRKRPAITTHNHDNHGVRSRDWRYIRYADGTEELYDMRQDPHEWHNLAGDPQYAPIVAEHRSWVPDSRPPVPGSAHRILVRKPDGTVIWEGDNVPADAPIPELTGLPLSSEHTAD